MDYLLVFLFLVALPAYGYWRDNHLIKAAYASGKRAGLNEAIEVVLDRAEVALRLVPKGQLGLGVIRCQALSNVAYDLRHVRDVRS